MSRQALLLLSILAMGCAQLPLQAADQEDGNATHAGYGSFNRSPLPEPVPGGGFVSQPTGANATSATNATPETSATKENATAPYGSPSNATPGILESPTGRTIKAGIIVDTGSYSPTDAELQEFFIAANNMLVNKTDVGMELAGISRVEFESGSPDPASIVKTEYGGNPPEFVIIMHADEMSAAYGGYAASFQLSGFCNRFRSAHSPNNVYGAVIDWNHMFGACGYDYSDPARPAHESAFATDGQCRNRPGTPCVLNEGLGYYMCDDEETLQSFYASGRYNFAASTAIHELMHHFGGNGVYDHFGTAECGTLMGVQSYDDGRLDTFQRSAGICPAVFDSFKNSYMEC